MLFVDDSDVSIDYNCTVKVQNSRILKSGFSNREKTVFPILYIGTKTLEILKLGIILKTFTHAAAFFLRLEVELHIYTNIAI